MAKTATQIAREREVEELIQRWGLTIEPFGKAWRVHGPGVDVLVQKKASLSENDLRPHGG